MSNACIEAKDYLQFETLKTGLLSPCFEHTFSLKASLYYINVKGIRKQQQQVEN